MNNPYEAPKSDVRDVEPERLVSNRPRQIVHATLSFWLSVLISVPFLGWEADGAAETVVLIVSATVLVGVLVLMAVVNVAMWRGRNWARVVFLVFSVLSAVTFVLTLGELLKHTAIHMASVVVSTVLDVVVSYLLFTKPGSLWFKTVQPAQ